MASLSPALTNFYTLITLAYSNMLIITAPRPS